MCAPAQQRAALSVAIPNKEGRCKQGEKSDGKNAYVDRGVIMDDTILYDLRKFLFRHTKSRVHLVKRIREIVRVDPQILHIV